MDQAKQATPRHVLDARLMDPNNPKSEAEWYAAAELASLRAKLAEAEASRDTARAVADAFRDTISRATRNPDAVHGLMMLCESHEKLAEWEAAGRKLAEYFAAEQADSEAWSREDPLPSLGAAMELARRAVLSDPLASRLVAEAGGKHG